MKLICLIILGYVGCATANTQTATQRTTFIITKTTLYCGGANPPQQIIDEAQKQRIPFGEKFYIISGNNNTKGRAIIATLQMDSTGKAYSNLSPGNYAVISAFGFNDLKIDSTQFDPSCLKEHWATPLFLFKVQAAKKDTILYNINEECPYNKPCLKVGQALPM